MGAAENVSVTPLATHPLDSPTPRDARAGNLLPLTQSPAARPRRPESLRPMHAHQTAGCVSAVTLPSSRSVRLRDLFLSAVPPVEARAHKSSYVGLQVPCARQFPVSAGSLNRQLLHTVQ